MKIIKDGQPVSIVELVKEYELKLLKQAVVTLCSTDHVEHIAAYFAWLNVGGRIFIKAPFLTEAQSTFLDERVSNLTYKDAVFFHSSGTTGMPKIAVHQKRQFKETGAISTATLGWTPEDKYLNFLPAFTVGFWNIILSALSLNRFTIVLGSRETAITDLQGDCNVSIIVPALLDQIRLRNVPVDFSKFNRIGIGSSPVLPRHYKFFFDNGGNKLINIYGATEVGTPILNRASTKDDQYAGYINLTPLNNSEFKLVDNVLYIKGDSLCSNIEDFECIDGWFNTNDRWVQEGNMIKFDGRTNDIVKLNGFSTSLLAIEHAAEDYTQLGDSIAVVRNSLGTDWIELFFTNKEHTVNRQELQAVFKDHVPEHSVPRKFTWIESIPRNGMGKKVRANNL